jgi:hypothetical protein
MGENISYGGATGEAIIMQLFVDDGVFKINDEGVKIRGHRENIVAPKFNYTGVAVCDHRVFRKEAVLAYAGSITNNAKVAELRKIDHAAHKANPTKVAVGKKNTKASESAAAKARNA